MVDGCVYLVIGIIFTGVMFAVKPIVGIISLGFWVFLIFGAKNFLQKNDTQKEQEEADAKGCLGIFLAFIFIFITLMAFMDF